MKTKKIAASLAAVMCAISMVSTTVSAGCFDGDVYSAPSGQSNVLQKYGEYADCNDTNCDGGCGTAACSDCGDTTCDGNDCETACTDCGDATCDGDDCETACTDCGDATCDGDDCETSAPTQTATAGKTTKKMSWLERLLQMLGFGTQKTQATDTTDKTETPAEKTETPAKEPTETKTPSKTTETPAKEPAKTETPAVSNTTCSQYAKDMLTMINKARADVGAPALQLSSELCNAANIRAKETATSFSHTRPDGRSFYTVLDDIKYSGSRSSGENIAAGNSTVAATFDQWMNSQGHYENMMNANYKYVGIGYYKTNSGYTYYWAQIFSY